MKKDKDPSRFPDYLEVRFSGPEGPAEVFGDFMTRISGRGVWLQEPPAPGGEVTVTGYLDLGPETEAQRTALLRLAVELEEQAQGAKLSLGFNDLAGRDWNQNWRQYFKPREVAPGLVVAPPWEVPSPRPGVMALLIEPGQAFGTGQHESTLLVLRRLERLHGQGKMPARVLDVGTGTGVLALAALLWDAESALAVDIDPLALEATKHNARINKLGDSMEISGADFRELEESFPLVLANLTAGDLIDLAPDLARRLAPGGELIASGILQEQADAVREALEATGLDFGERSEAGEWACLVMVRP